MTNAQFAQYHPKYENVIRAIARKYAGADADLFDDLVSCGTIGLYEADLRRPYKNEDAFLRNVIRNRVVDHLRWLDPERYDRLDKHVAQGAQVVADPETGNGCRLLQPTSGHRAPDIDRLHGSGQRGNSLGWGVSADEDYDG